MCPSPCRSVAVSPAHFRSALFLAASLLAGALPAAAQMTVLSADRWTQARAEYQGVVNQVREDAPSPTAYFESIIEALAEKYEPCVDPPPDECLVGSCSSNAFQFSEFFPAGIQFSGGTSASWGIPPSGSWEFVSNVYFRFHVDTAFDYQLFAQVDPGDWPTLSLVGGDVVLESGGGLEYHYLSDGTLVETGTLGPGDYVLRGRSTGSSDEESFQGAVYAAQWLVTPVAQPIVTVQPLDLEVPCGSEAGFSISTSGPAGSYTYQWRKNLVPLANSAHVSGATTPALTIHDACDADSGYYDVVVTTLGGPAVTEPSRLAHLTISTSTAVGDEPGSPGRTLSVTMLGPNPFRLATTLRYALPGPAHLRAEVYDLAGARIRTLVDDHVPGAGTVSWDGTTHSGARAPHGVYLIKLEAGGLSEARKVVVVD